jgi:uncharacterized protein (TIGR00730 family)
MKSIIKGRINKKHFRVAIFGSARTKKNQTTYKMVHTLAKMIAKEEIDLITGGGPGLMDAASRGHHAGRKNKYNGSHSIGLTIKLPHEQTKDYHLDIEKDFNKFSGRLDKFMQLSNVVVVAPGGVGTILEFFYTWQLLQVKQICDNIPIILLGSMWKGLIEWIKKQPLKNRLLSKEDLNNIFIVNNCQEAIKIIKMAKEEFKAGHGKVCSNLKKYK